MPSKEFKKLQAEWYKKLKDTGFNDLEKGDTFKSQGLFAGKFQFLYTADPIKWAAKEDYYRQCRAFLHENKFKGHKLKRMWELHSEGMADLKIAQALTTKRRKLTRDKIWAILNRMEQKMLHGRQKAEQLRVVERQYKAELETKRQLRKDLKLALTKAKAEIKATEEKIEANRRAINEVDW